LADPPQGAARAGYVREMFEAVARRYDLLNHLLSGGLDHRWRAGAAAACARALREAGAGAAPLVGPPPPAAGDPRGRGSCTPSVGPPLVLDLCCGTGDLGLAVLARVRRGRVVACDFCRPMLRRAGGKFARAGASRRTALVEADALALPLADAAVDAVVCGFGLRNLADPGRGLAEMVRVLAPGGPAVVLEFHRPEGQGVLAGAFRLYFRRLLPRLGGLASGGDCGGYAYLVASVEAFGPAEATADAMSRAGLERVRRTPLAGGIASVYVGHKAAGPGRTPGKRGR